MKKSDVISTIFDGRTPLQLRKTRGEAFAPTNIALCKYWGKRDLELNLPVTSSLSIALPSKGAKTVITPHHASKDHVRLNGQTLLDETVFVKRLVAYLDLFRRNHDQYLHIDITMNLPVAAGLASSACGFASVILALNDCCDWQLPLKTLSILARLGSGSAARSLWHGFVEWHAGVEADGSDAYAEPIHTAWDELCVGLLCVSEHQKPIASRDAMRRTVETSTLYDSWPKKVSHDLALIKEAIFSKAFDQLGSAAESNALSMHATMLAAWPPIAYSLPETLNLQHQIWRLREAGLSIYFTQDAGPNLKLLFLSRDIDTIKSHFPTLEVLPVFSSIF